MWVAAPLTGLLVQPIIGHMSRPHLARPARPAAALFRAGAILAALSLFLMPLAPALLFAALLLWMLDASLNISMEPFRAFVGDMLRKDQHTAGYAVQTAFIGAGAVLGSLIPPALEMWGVSNVAAGGGIPDTVRYAFWIGGAALFAGGALDGRHHQGIFAARRWQRSARRPTIRTATRPFERLPRARFGSSLVWIAAGVLVVIGVEQLALEKEMYLLGGLLIAYGLASIIAIALARKRKHDQHARATSSAISPACPTVMKRLALVQFFSWSALFIMWIYTTPVVAQYFFGSADPDSSGYQDAGNRVGTLFAIYNGVAAVAALTLLPWLSSRIGKARTHMVCLAVRRGGLCELPLHPRPAVADPVGNRRRHRLGVDPRHALRDPRVEPAAAEARHLHGPVQHLHRRPAAAGRDRHGLDHEGCFPERADLDDARRGGRDGAGGAGDDPR